MATPKVWADVAQLPIRQPTMRAPSRTEIPSDDDMGLNDPQNVLYINMEAVGLDGKFRDRIHDLEQMLQLTQQLATIHAGIQVKQRIAEGVLPGDSSKDSQWRRSQYRLRVLETYFLGGTYTWIYSPLSTTSRNGIRVERSKFHWQLLTYVLAGIVLPRPLAASLEAIFKGIGDTISETTYSPNGRSFWNMIQVYTFDEVRQNLSASLRNVTYTLDQNMHTVTRNKNTQTTISVDFDFGQSDFSFNETTWRTLKPTVESYINGTGIDNITNPPTVPV